MPVVKALGFDRLRLKKLLEDRESLCGMRSAFETIMERQLENLEKIPDLQERKERLRDIKTQSVGNSELFDRALEMLRENGFRVVIAKSAQEAMSVIRREISSERRVLKSKSNISKELDVVHNLEAEGIEVIETDLGDRILQICGESPVHPTGPAAHLTRYQIAEILSKHYKREIPPEPEVMAELVRDELDGYFREARVSITGANAIAAGEGAIVLIHNEGNITRCSQVPGKQIILTTPEKIVPTLEDAINQVKLQTYYGTGKISTAHIEVIAGCSYTADIEKKIFRGMHGPKEIVIIFLDDGRLEMGNSELLYCIGCGNCLLTCPVYDLVGPAFGSPGHMGGIGVALSSNLESADRADEQGLFLCTACGMCKEQCPVSIDIRPEIFEGRSMISKNRHLEEHDAAIASISNYDNPWMQPRSRRAKWARELDLSNHGEVFFFPGCSESFLRPEIAKMTVELFRDGGIEVAYLGENESCCGSIARKLGNPQLFEKQITQLLQSLTEGGAKKVITSCPGCMISLNLGKELLGMDDLEVVHVAQVLSESFPEISGYEGKDVRVTYHDPCELGRGLNVFDEPRKLIRSVKGVDFVDLLRSHETSACCGAGAGVKSGYDNLAQTIAKKRLDIAKDSGASIMITTCPWCLENLSSSNDDSEMSVEDLVEFIHRNHFFRRAE